MLSPLRALAALLLCAAAVAPAVASAQTTEPGKLDIAVVDVQKILRQSAATRTIRPQIDKLKKEYQERFKTREQTLRAASQDLARQRSVLSPEAYETQREAFEKRASTAQREVQAVQRRLDGALSSAMGKVHRALRDIVAEYAREKEIKLILPKSGVLLMETRFDITAEIMDRLNSQLPKVEVVLPPPEETPDGSGGRKE